MPLHPLARRDTDKAILCRLQEDFDTKGLITRLISAGMRLCQYDFQEEVDATVKMVEKNMGQYGYRFPQY